MKFKRSQVEDIHINLTPMIDCLLFILVHSASHHALCFSGFQPFSLRALRIPLRTLRLKTLALFSLNILFITDCVRDGSDILLRCPYF